MRRSIGFAPAIKLPLDASSSVRGSQAGEMMARRIVETGTSSYYSALKDATEEPVLKQVCAKIAADEFRHYKLFYEHLRRACSATELSRAGPGCASAGVASGRERGR